MGTYENVTGRFYASLYLRADGKIQASIVSQNLASDDAISTIPCELNKSYDITMAYDGNSVKLYVNGQLSASTARTFSASSNNVLPLSLGYHPYSGFDGTATYKLNGNLSQVKIFDRTLSALEVQSMLCHDGIKNQNETSVDFGGVCGTVPRN